MCLRVRKLGAPIPSRIASGIRLARSKTSLMAERRASTARLAIPASDLDVAMTLEARPGRVAALDLVANLAFAADDLLGAHQHGERVRARHDQDPVELGDDDVARMHDDAA